MDRRAGNVRKRASVVVLALGCVMWASVQPAQGSAMSQDGECKQAGPGQASTTGSRSGSEASGSAGAQGTGALALPVVDASQGAVLPAPRMAPARFGLADVLALAMVVLCWTLARGLRRMRKPRRRTRPARWLEHEGLELERARARRALSGNA